MLETVASYRCMQFQGKRMNQTWENGKKLNFEPDFGLFGPDLGTQIFFRKFYLYQMLGIVANYPCKQFHVKIMTQVNDEKPGLNLGPLGPNSGRRFFSVKNVASLVTRYHSYHQVQYQKKLMIKSWENLVTDGQTDGQTEGRQWFHGALSD